MTLKRFTLQLALAGLVSAPCASWAAGLGKLTVQSALGQPLKAEIEIFADKAELADLSATLASEQAFSDARIGLAPVLSGLRFAIEKRPSGKAVLKLTTATPVNEPFIDMLVELNWSSGKLTREFTLLLDPPSYVAPKPAVVRAPQGATTDAIAAPSRPAVDRTADTPDTVSVRSGDTLAAIARRVKPESASLDQALVGLYRANPRAFSGNMNRLKAGATLKVPGEDALAALSPAQARREIRVQNDAWRGYRKAIADSVAATAPAASPTPDGSTASGKLSGPTRAVPPPATETRDVLTLGKATLPGERASAEEQLQAQEADATAREKALAESAERIAMLEKQIQEMHELVARKGEGAAAGAGDGPLAAPAPAAAPGWYEPLLSNPLYWGGGLALIALGGFLWWSMAGGGPRKKATPSFEDSLMKNDMTGVSVATNLGGGAVNTGNSSFLTDFSQSGLGAIDTQDVDPVAEADVYMAYGRDSQAEEILKEAVGKYPERHEIRMKLLDIYAARRNAAAYESVAGALLAALGNPPGPLWDKACEGGRMIDPANPLYGGTAGAAVADAQANPDPGALADDKLIPLGSVSDVSRAEFPKMDLPDLDLSTETDVMPTLDTGLASDSGPDSKFDFSGLDLDIGDDSGAVDEVATKLDLARAYVEMGDKEGAREILGEVLQEGSDTQKTAARSLLDTLG